MTYVRSASGEPTKITREDGSYMRIEYDAALRVSKESHFDANDVLVAEISYGYDADGNRASKTTLTGNETYSYEAGFKLAGITHSAGGPDDAFGYDAGGRLTSLDRDGLHRVMEYDSSDPITRVVDGGIERARYAFDGLGRRVSANDGTGIKRFLSAPNLGDGYESPQAVTDASGNLVAAFIYSGEHPIAKVTPTGIEYFLSDAMGSIMGKADAAGASTASIHYDAFGNVTSAVGPSAAIDSAVGTEQRFHGMQFDAATGIYFVRARSYDPTTGRFVSRDPIGGILSRPDTMNSYVMDRSNPHVWRDPSGEMSLLELTATTAVISVFASVAIPTFAHFVKEAASYQAGTFVGNEGATAFFTGAADTLGLGLGKYIRNSLFQDLGWNDNVDVQSDDYTAGVAAGLILSILQGAIGGVASGARAAGSTSAVLGKFSAGALPNYIEVGQSFNVARFSLPGPLYAALERIGMAEAVNLRWLDLQIKLGRQFVLASEPTTKTVGGAYASEIAYLLRRGYQIVGNGEAGSLLVPML